jgi:mannose/cellobiose epimerase-like protein (N-acyl-D-glucosamine 2-epimerase family)
MTTENPMSALRNLSAALARDAGGLGLRLVQFDCTQAFQEDGPQEFFQAVFVLADRAEPQEADQDHFDATFAEIQASLVAESDSEKMQQAIREATELHERLEEPEG